MILVEYDQLPTIDVKVLQSLKSLEDPSSSDGFVNTLIDTFEEQCQLALQHLNTAIASQDARGVEVYAHKMKGVSRNLGAAKMAKICDFIETNAASIEAKNISQLMQNLSTEFEQAQKELNEHWRG